MQNKYDPSEVDVLLSNLDYCNAALCCVQNAVEHEQSRDILSKALQFLGDGYKDILNGLREQNGMAYAATREVR